MDINLLNDTKGTEPDKAKPPVPAKTEFTTPAREHLDDPQGKPPSGVSVWFKGLFAPKPETARPEALKTPSTPKIKVPKGMGSPEVIAAPEDMYAELEKPTPAPAAAPKTPAPRPAPAPSPFRPLGRSLPPLPSSPPPSPTVAPAAPPTTRPLAVSRPMTPMTSLPRAKVPPPAKPPRRSLFGGRTPKAPDEPEGGTGGFRVNLLPEELAVSTVEVRQRAILLGLMAAIGAALVIGVYLLLELYQSNVTNRTATLTQELNEIDREIAALRPSQRDANRFVTKVKILDQGLRSHIRWTYFFERLERYTVDGINYGGAFQSTTGGSLTLTGNAISVDEVAHQLAVFQRSAQDFATDATLGSVSHARAAGGVESDTYSFTMNLTLAPGVFVTAPAPASPQEATP